MRDDYDDLRWSDDMSTHSPRRTVKEPLDGLEPGQTFGHVAVIPSGEVTRNSLLEVKESLRNTITRAISRLRHEFPERQFSLETQHIINEDLRAIVVLVVTRDK